MEFASYFVIRALQHGWDVLKTKDAEFWDHLFPPSIPVAERRQARELLLKNDILIRPAYHLSITRDSMNVVAVRLHESNIAVEQPLSQYVDPELGTWEFDDGIITMYCISYNEMLMMTIAHVVRGIMSSYIQDGWFIRQGFDRFARLRTESVPYEEIMDPDSVLRYVRRIVFSASMSTMFPRLDGLNVFEPKPVFVADEHVLTDSMLDPVTGDEYEFGGTLGGGVTPTTNTDKEG